MYALTREIPLRSIATQHLPSLAVSLMIAETFYKWHSFTLECLGFLATWYAIDRVRCAVVDRFGKA